MKNSALADFKKNMGKFLPYLEDLRKKIYRGIVLFIILFISGFLFAGIFLKKLLIFIHIDHVTITTSSPFQYTKLALDVGFFFGLMFFIPYITYSLYTFILPALTMREKIKFLKSIPLSIILFVAGFFYGFSILYQALGLLASLNDRLGISNFWNISNFLSEILLTSALLGLIFELPLLVSLLLRLGIVTPQKLRKNRRIAYFLIFCLTSLLPPTDGISLLIMALPLILLYEATILLNNKKKSYAWITTNQVK